MKKLILNSLITAITLVGPTLALAEESGAEINTAVKVKASSTTQRSNPLKSLMEARREVRASTTEARKENREEAREKIKEARSNIASSSEKRKENREDRREDRVELIKNKIAERFKKMFMRFQATIERQTMIMDKVNTRIAKVKAAGGDAANAEKFTAEAKVHLGEAQTSLNMLKVLATSTAEIDAQLLATTTSPGTVTKETLKKMKGITEQIEKHLREAHKALENAVKNLRGMSSVNVNAGATTTATTTSN